MQFNPDGLDVKWLEGRWHLTAGGVVLKDFGRREQDAREALRILRDLRVNQRGEVGTPRPIMEYWLADGQAPTPSGDFRRLVAFNRDALRVERLQGQWCVRDDRQCLFNFGSRPEEAHQALELIRRYNFDRVGYVGQPTPVLIYFLGATDTPSAPPLAQDRMNPRRRATGKDGDAGKAGDGIQQVAARGAVQPGQPALAPAGRQLGLPNAAAPHLAAAERVPLDWRQVQVRQVGGEWHLVYGAYTVARFGKDEREARRAWAAVQFFRFTEHCLVGGPEGRFRYFLVGGQAPRGRMLGMSGRHFRAEALAVRKEGDDFVLGDGSFALLRFGARADEAKEALQAIQKHRFDYLARIGPDDGGLMVLSRLR
jgi:hypothetical protein